MKKLILFAIFFILIFYFVDLDVFDNEKLEDGDWDNNVSLGECEFRLEFVNDNLSRQKGLSDRDSLCDECGMLFEFLVENKQTFWMKNMRFDLDIIWIVDNEVIAIEKDVSYNLEGIVSSPSPVNRVLEILKKVLY
jgi:uncharacterized membrane protein (UPF0127 family)